MIQKLNLVFRVILLLLCLSCVVFLIIEQINVKEQALRIFNSTAYFTGILATFYAYMRWHIIETIWNNPDQFSDDIKREAFKIIPNFSKLLTAPQNSQE